MTKTSKTAAKHGRHLPSVTFTLTHPVDDRLMVLTSDIGHRRVTVYTGKNVATLRNSDIRVFADRESHRDYVEFRLDAAEAAGFVAI